MQFSPALFLGHNQGFVDTNLYNGAKLCYIYVIFASQGFMIHYAPLLESGS